MKMYECVFICQNRERFFVFNFCVSQIDLIYHWLCISNDNKRGYLSIKTLKHTQQRQKYTNNCLSQLVKAHSQLCSDNGAVRSDGWSHVETFIQNLPEQFKKDFKNVD